MVRVAAWAVLLAGCDAVFGLTNLPTPPDAIDAPPTPFVVNGTLRHHYVANDATFSPQTGERVFPAGTVALTAILDDGTQTTVEHRADGSFSFPVARPAQPYRLLITIDGRSGEIQGAWSTLAVSSDIAGRPDRRDVVATYVQLPYPSASVTEQGAYISSTGLYTFSYTGLHGPSVTFDWRLAVGAPGAVPGMLDASKHDRAYALEMVVDRTVTDMHWTTIAGVASGSITQVGGSTSALPQPQPVPRDRCVRFAAANGNEHQRIITAAPRTYSGSLATWHVYAAPAPEHVGIAGALWVAACTYSPARNVQYAPTFHNPYPGTTAVVESGVLASFDTKLPSASTALRLYNVSSRYARVEPATTASCANAAEVVLDPNVALPGGITLGGTPLDSDAKVVALDLAQPVLLEWTLAAPGRVDTFTIGLYELVVINDATTVIHVRGINTAGQTTALIDQSLFVPGRTYLVAVTASISRPNATNGDWTTLSLPWENASTWSHYFEAQAR